MHYFFGINISNEQIFIGAQSSLDVPIILLVYSNKVPNLMLFIPADVFVEMVFANAPKAMIHNYQTHWPFP